jgi:hypothetical protein
MISLSTIHAIPAAGSEKEAIDPEIEALGVSKPAAQRSSGCVSLCGGRTEALVIIVFLFPTADDREPKRLLSVFTIPLGMPDYNVNH